MHYPSCPVITGVEYENVALRRREREDFDANSALEYLINIQAPAIRARQCKIGKFVFLYSQHYCVIS